MVKCPRGTTEQINANVAFLKTLDSCTNSDTSSEQGSIARYYDSGDENLEGEVHLSQDELDIIRADQRHPPTVEDEITYLFVNHFLDILLKSWEGTPCPKPKLVDCRECVNPELLPEEGELSGEGGARLNECTQPFNMSIDYLNDIYKTRSQKFSRTNETGEGRLPAMCKTRCDSQESSGSSDAESAMTGEQTVSESELSWKAQVPDEEVSLSFQNGAWYSGRVSRRLMDGNGTFFWEDGGSFEGEFINGTATGFGKLQFPNLSTYEGTVYKGFRHGEGLHYMYDSTTMYSGQWWLGKKSGTGIIFYDDPVRCLNFYKGSWTNGKKDGFGYRQYPSGSKYVGFWQDGKRHGTGIMFWCNHDIYRGEWKNGLMDGFGEYIWNGFVNRTLSYPRVNAYRGFWEKGKRNGIGLLELTNGSCVETVWVDDEKNGPGAAICPNGSVVVSNNNKLFKNDKPALLNNEEEDCLGLLLRNQGFQINRKKYSKKEVHKIPDQDQLISFMSSMEKAKAISIPIHTPVHSLDLGCHVKRFMEQKNELLSKKIAHSSGVDMRNRPGTDAAITRKFSCHRDVNLSPEFFTHEEKLLRYSIMINLIRLKECYEDWSIAACPDNPPFQCILMRIFFWEMLTQGDVPRRNFSLIDIDNILDMEESFMIDFPHEPFEKIQLWQFIHFLITISWYSYGRYVNEDNISPVHPNVNEFLESLQVQNEKAVIAPAFNFFLQKHIFLPHGSTTGKKWIKHKNLVPFQAMYMLYKKVGEPHSAKQFLRAVFSKDQQPSRDPPLYIEKIQQSKNLGHGGMTFTNELAYLSSQEPFNYPQLFPTKEHTHINIDSELNCFSELGPKGVVKCLEHVCPNIVEDGLIVDMEYQLTFLEFYKVVITCAEILLKNRALKKTQSEIISNYKKELEEYEKLMKEYEKQKEAAMAATKKVSNLKKPKK